VRGARYRGCCLEAFTPWALASGTDLALGCWLAAGRCLPTTTMPRRKYRLGVKHLEGARARSPGHRGGAAGGAALPVHLGARASSGQPAALQVVDAKPVLRLGMVVVGKQRPAASQQAQGQVGPARQRPRREGLEGSSRGIASPHLVPASTTSANAAKPSMFSRGRASSAWCSAGGVVAQT